MRLTSSLPVVVVLALNASNANGQIPYTHTRVALTGAGQPFSGLFAPGLNGNGVASFGANLSAGGSGVFVGSGGAVTTIAQTGSTFLTFNDPNLPAINPASSMAAFYAARTAAAGGGVGIFTSSGGPVTTIAATGGSSPFTNFVAVPGINPGGTVALVGIGPTGQGVFTGNGGALTTIRHDR